MPKIAISRAILSRCDGRSCSLRRVRGGSVFGAGSDDGRTAPSFLERGNLVDLLERQPHLVLPLQQALAAEGIDLKRKRQAVLSADRAGVQIDGQLVRRMLPRPLE